MARLLTDEEVGIVPQISVQNQPKRLLTDEQVGITSVAPSIPAAPSAPGIPSPIQTPQQPQERFVDRFGITTALEMAPAVAGGAIGAASGLLTGPGAPVASPAGMLVGGALGAAAGRGLANLARDFEDNLLHGEPMDRDLAEQSLDMLQAGTTDLAFGMGIHGLGRLLSNTFRFAGKLTGAQSPEVARTIQEASEGGVGVGPIDLNKPFFDIASRVGGVMPIVGGPIRAASETKAAQISRQFVSATLPTALR